MKETIEQASKQYSCGLRELDRKNAYDNIDVDSARMVAFKRGAEWQAKQSPWISVEERLPDSDDDLYIVLDKKLNPHGCGVCEFNLDINKWVSSGGIIVNPTHWMPIPE